MKDILFLSHCMPTLPDKGERIRAFHELQYLIRHYRVHVACFAREARPVSHMADVKSRCGSFYYELIQPAALPRAACRLLRGQSLNSGYFDTRSMRAYIAALAAEVHLSATVAFSVAVAPLAPAGVPLLLDMVDVDSVKWAAYAERRHPRILYATEARRLRELEAQYSQRAGAVVVTTEQEAAVLRQITPNPRLVRVVNNGVDSRYFDPGNLPPAPPGLTGKRYAAMVGAMDYYPNAQGAAWFATEIFPQLRRNIPDLEFIIVGHKPSHAVRRLGDLPGVTVTGYVPDVRPYIANSLLTVTPLRIARGIQNKVLESLVMGKAAAVSPDVARTFGERLPAGLLVCKTAADYEAAVRRGIESPAPDASLRAGIMETFCWERALGNFSEAIEEVAS
jgi:sugar transferase (PEP-CTERM/EpsH1 system associated)